MKYTEFESLVGKVLTKITNNGDELIFETSTGEKYKMFHDQDCCESVSIEDIDSDIQDLVGDPILLAEVRTKDDEEDTDGSSMWTFYTIRTIKASVTIRWYGSSNGYYSIGVDFYQY